MVVYEAFESVCVIRESQLGQMVNLQDSSEACNEVQIKMLNTRLENRTEDECSKYERVKVNERSD